MWNPKIVYRISAENNKHSSLYRPILFVQREDFREKKKKRSSSTSPNSILSFSSNLATVERSWIARKPFSTVFFIRDFYPEATRSRRPLFLINRLKSWYSVTARGVVTRPGLRSRPPPWAREPNRRLAATSAVWRTSGLRICWWTAPASRAAAGRTSPANFSFGIRNQFFPIVLYVYKF